MKKIIIAGGTGYLGKQLEAFFQSKHCAVIILSRNPKASNHEYWDGKNLGDWCRLLEDTDCVINLSGKSVDCRYTATNKKMIIDSRVNATKVLQQAIELSASKPKLWINASSATIYTHAETQLMTESNGTIGDDFSMNVCKVWEQTFFETEIEGLRKVALRTSIVMGRSGGGLAKLLRLAKLGMAGHQGSGNQKVSWIHETDFCRAVWFLMNTPFEGPFNLTSPKPVSNKNLMKTIREKLNIPIGISVASPLLEIGTWLMRTESELVLKSRNVYPERLLDLGFKFRYGHISEILN